MYGIKRIHLKWYIHFQQKRQLQGHTLLLTYKIVLNSQNRHRNVRPSQILLAQARRDTFTECCVRASLIGKSCVKRTKVQHRPNLRWRAFGSALVHGQWKIASSRVRAWSIWTSLEHSNWFVFPAAYLALQLHWYFCIPTAKHSNISSNTAPSTLTLHFYSHSGNRWVSEGIITLTVKTGWISHEIGCRLFPTKPARVSHVNLALLCHLLCAASTAEVVSFVSDFLEPQVLHAGNLLLLQTTSSL